MLTSLLLHCNYLAQRRTCGRFEMALPKLSLILFLSLQRSFIICEAGRLAFRTARFQCADSSSFSSSYLAAAAVAFPYKHIAYGKDRDLQ